MKNISYLIVIVFLSGSLAEAQRGGRGGGGGRPSGGMRPGGVGGGMSGGFHPSRPSEPIARPTPHPTPRPPQDPRPGTLPVTRPGPGGGIGGSRPIGGGGMGPGPGFGGPRPGVGPGHPTTLPTRPGGRPGAGDIGKFLGGNPPGHFPGNPGFRPGYNGYHKSEFYGHIHNHFPYSPRYGYPFGRNWCANFHWHYHHWPYWTAAATAVTLTAWLGYGAYGGYGTATQIPYYPVEPAPADVYETSVEVPAQICDQGLAPVSDDTEWLNLGTFGIIPYQGTDFAYGIQLAISKDGIIRGIQWDMKGNTATEIAGSIQRDGLKIAWRAKTANAPYFESTVDQLTQPESYVNVYDPIAKSLVSWQMIQIDPKDLPGQ